MGHTRKAFAEGMFPQLKVLVVLSHLLAYLHHLQAPVASNSFPLISVNNPGLIWVHSDFLHYDPCTRCAGYSCSPKGSSTMCAEQGSLVVSSVVQTKNRGSFP